MTKELLVLDNLKAYYYLNSGIVQAVDGVSFTVAPGEILAVIGESGSGKSTIALSIMGLLKVPPGRIEAGRILFQGNDLLQLSEGEMRNIRGNNIAMVSQDPMTSLNPACRIGDQIAESLSRHRGMIKNEAMARAVEMLALTGIPAPEKRAMDFPRQLSAGLLQRVMIAMALCCEPQLLIVDEPARTLDVTIQAQIINLLLELKGKFPVAMIIITHNPAVAAEMANRAVVMYAGRVVEEGPVVDLFEEPMHPYTRGLLSSIPRLYGKQEQLYMIEGEVPNPLRLPGGCAFAPRCSLSNNKCQSERPPMIYWGLGRRVRCWLVRGEACSDD